MNQNRQTLSFLTRRFREVGIQPVTRHGQNFLIDLNLIELLVESANLGPQDVVLEIGTGTGSLTALMAPRVAAVVTVELDANLHQLAREELVDFDNVTLLQQDALRNKNHFHPNVMNAVREALAAGPDRQLKLAANLPYNIATPVISNLLLTEVVPVSMTVTIQKEVAERLTARPGTKDYNALSIWVQSQCDVDIVRIMPPTVFWPRPKVESAIIHVTFNPEKRARIADLESFHTFVRAMFFHRRKFLRSELLAATNKRLTKPEVDRVLEECGLSGELRAEQLDVESMLALHASVERHAAK